MPKDNNPVIRNARKGYNKEDVNYCIAILNNRINQLEKELENEKQRAASQVAEPSMFDDYTNNQINNALTEDKIENSALFFEDEQSTSYDKACDTGSDIKQGIAEQTDITKEKNVVYKSLEYSDDYVILLEHENEQLKKKMKDCSIEAVEQYIKKAQMFDEFRDKISAIINEAEKTAIKTIEAANEKADEIQKTANRNASILQGVMGIVSSNMQINKNDIDKILEKMSFSFDDILSTIKSAQSGLDNSIKNLQDMK